MTNRENGLIGVCLVLALLCFIAFFGGMFLGIQSMENNNQVVNELEDIFSLLLVILQYLKDLLDK